MERDERDKEGEPSTTGKGRTRSEREGHDETDGIDRAARFLRWVNRFHCRSVGSRSHLSVHGSLPIPSVPPLLSPYVPFRRREEGRE